MSWIDDALDIYKAYTAANAANKGVQFQQVPQDPLKAALTQKLMGYVDNSPTRDFYGSLISQRLGAANPGFQLPKSSTYDPNGMSAGAPKYDLSKLLPSIGAGASGTGAGGTVPLTNPGDQGQQKPPGPVTQQPIGPGAGGAGGVGVGGGSGPSGGSGGSGDFGPIGSYPGASPQWGQMLSDHPWISDALKTGSAAVVLGLIGSTLGPAAAAIAKAALSAWNHFHPPAVNDPALAGGGKGSPVTDLTPGYGNLPVSNPTLPGMTPGPTLPDPTTMTPDQWDQYVNGIGK